MRFWAKVRTKTYFVGLLLFSISLMLFSSGCGGSGGGGSGSSVAGTDTVTITGDFEGGTYAQNNWLDQYISGLLPSAHAFDPSKASKVLAFFGNGKHVISDVNEDGGFSINVAKGAPTGLIFVGESDNYLGYLTLGNGIDSLPLQCTEEDTAIIDLETLSSSDKVVETPARLFENEIPLTAEEQDTIGFADDMFATIVKNPDVDDNGTIDFLERKFFRLFIMYFFYGGDFEGSLTPTVNQPSEIWNGFKFFLRTGPNWPETVYFTGPDGSGYNSTPSATREVYDDHTAYYSQYNDSLNYPPAGQYTIDYTLESGPGTLKFNIPDQSQASANTILPIPTVVLNSDDTINKVTWMYKAAKENASEVRPQALIERIELQIAGNGVQCENPRQENRMYNSGNLASDTKEHVLRCQNLLWSTVTNITLAYDDVYGNHNVVTWVHQSAR